MPGSAAAVLLIAFLLVLAAMGDARLSGADENSNSLPHAPAPSTPEGKTWGPYDSRIHTPGWVQPPPLNEDIQVDESVAVGVGPTTMPPYRDHGVIVPAPTLSEGKLKFPFFHNQTLGELYLQATSSGAKAVPSADCTGEDCLFKFEKRDADEGGIGYVKIKATGPCGGSADYDCCLSWVSHANDAQGPGTAGVVAVAACSSCGEYCEWCRERNPHTHPGIDPDRSLVRLSPSKTTGVDQGSVQSCSHVCIAGRETEEVFLRHTLNGDTAGRWDCRMEFVS